MASKSSVPIALICATRRRISTGASTKQGLEKAIPTPYNPALFPSSSS
jgi:hypothetical protein